MKTIAIEKRKIALLQNAVRALEKEEGNALKLWGENVLKEKKQENKQLISFFIFTVSNFSTLLSAATLRFLGR